MHKNVFESTKMYLKVSQANFMKIQNRFGTWYKSVLHDFVTYMYVFLVHYDKGFDRKGFNKGLSLAFAGFP